MALQVIGAGFGRTGTLSLKLALEQLGFGPCYHMVEVLAKPKSTAFWSAAADRGPTDWNSIFEGYKATVGWPGASFWRELSVAYPDAKVILTERDEEAWFESTQATIFSEGLEKMPAPFFNMASRVIGQLFDQKFRDKDTLIAGFRRHNAMVKQVIPPERLLVYNVREGWYPLCQALGVSVPDAPFPRVNGKDDFLRHIDEVSKGMAPT